MLVRQRDVEADRRRTGVRRAAVGGFHQARAATGRHDVVAHMAVGLERTATLRRDAAEGAGLFVPERLPAGSILAHARGAEHDDGRAHTPRPQGFLGLGIFEQETNPSHGVAENEVLIKRGEPIGRKLRTVDIGGRNGRIHGVCFQSFNASPHRT